MKTSLIVLSLCLSLLTLNTGCQSQSVGGVYSGVILSISPMIGGGMDREDLTLYLRPDKTFSQSMEKADWKTHVEGKWSVQGKDVVLNYSDPKRKPRTFSIVSPEKLKSGGGYILFKMVMANSIPKGLYEFKYASGGGGIGSNLPYVGVSGNRYIYFDGKGNFSQDASKVVAVIGDNIGGGTNSSDNTAGTYTIKDGVLTLTTADGKKAVSSIFTHKDAKGETMATINGDLYFEMTQEEITKKLKNKKPETNTSARSKTDDNNTATGSTATDVSASSLTEKMRSAHGAAAIDQLKSVTVEATLQGLALKAVTDYSREWTRLETRQNGKLIMVEQLEGNSGWQWLKGKKTTLNDQRVKELKAGFSAGLAGLRKSKIQQLNTGTVKKQKSGFSLTYSSDGVEMVLICTDDFRIIGEAKQTATVFQGITYEDFRDVNGVLLPFTEKHTDGKTTMTVRISKIEVNKASVTDFSSDL
ncbi:hypothetical protein LZZ85_13705 [Terrimonas sp. NA20]|uniref:Lipocalin-like domain-containing protein n=1 Tax=Terrimonas ginsenosidimutans TaxID=2908004 RepID=A0ABS9KSN9_9BACT|nr:hypothetical protein [Terrimonas ginsenosidimutans]MCG2615350.1 hypothetical protein [Terrimonas ginsenosidimutans]